MDLGIVTIAGKPVALREPGLLDRLGIRDAIHGAGIDSPRIALAILGICLERAPHRQPGHPAAVYGEAVWGWLVARGATEEEVTEAITRGYEVASALMGRPATGPTEEAVAEAGESLRPIPG